MYHVPQERSWFQKQCQALDRDSGDLPDFFRGRATDENAKRFVSIGAPAMHARIQIFVHRSRIRRRRIQDRMPGPPLWRARHVNQLLPPPSPTGRSFARFRVVDTSALTGPASVWTLT